MFFMKKSTSRFSFGLHRSSCRFKGLKLNEPSLFKVGLTGVIKSLSSSSLRSTTKGLTGSPELSASFGCLKVSEAGIAADPFFFEGNFLGVIFILVLDDSPSWIDKSVSMDISERDN